MATVRMTCDHAFHRGMEVEESAIEPEFRGCTRTAVVVRGVSIDDLNKAVEQIRAEYLRARKKHAPMHSAHEGWAVIYEEFIVELGQHVWGDTGKSQAAYEEACQVAAMALAYMLEVAA